MENKNVGLKVCVCVGGGAQTYHCPPNQKSVGGGTCPPCPPPPLPTPVIYIYIYKRKEGNVLFNDALNTFYVRLYGVRHMVKDHSDSEKENPLPPPRLLFLINSKGSFICAIA